jgi:hypothetical protein
MKCVLCDQRKAKRFCPAKNTSICPNCCGEKRVLEIRCPETCEYLKSGRSRDMAEYVKHFRNMDQATFEKNKRIMNEHQDVVAHLESIVSKERLQSHSLTDQDLRQALDTLLETYRTEDKGILYERTSDDLRIDGLRRELRKVIESYRNPEGENNKGIVNVQQTRLPLQSAIGCLEFMRSMAVNFMAEKHASLSYVDILARIIPAEEEIQSSVIIP